MSADKITVGVEDLAHVVALARDIQDRTLNEELALASLLEALVNVGADFSDYSPLASELPTVDER